MALPKRKKVNMMELDIDSALILMQEIYNDIVAQQTTASLIMKKMLSFMKEAEDMSTIGPVIKEQQKLLNDCAEKKISLVKLQSTLIKQSNGGTKQEFQKMNLSDEDLKILENFVSGIDDSEPQKKTYDLK